MSAAALRLLLLNMTIMAYIPYWHNPVKHSTGRRSRFPGPPPVQRSGRPAGPPLLFVRSLVLSYSSVPILLAAMAFANQSLPSTSREMISAEQVSPVALTMVAAGSTRKPMVAMIGKASGGKP